ncbi:hypothetical protein evm_005182 [Chilo suppressalis]|nr:hypothetical protein evm_005182 [Chilo suppressalis]
MPYKMITTKRGLKLIMINGYTFSKVCGKQKMWWCSRRHQNCPAKGVRAMTMQACLELSRLHLLSLAPIRSGSCPKHCCQICSLAND